MNDLFIYLPEITIFIQWNHVQDVIKNSACEKLHQNLIGEIGGKICPECNKHISENTSYYESEYKEGELDFPKQKGTLAIQNFDDKRRVLFIEKDTVQFEIALEAIQKFENIDYTEKINKKENLDSGIKKQINIQTFANHVCWKQWRILSHVFR